MAGKVQRNIGGELELRGLALEPSAGGPFEVSPSISRVIANLAALNGSLTQLLKCDSAGRLLVSGASGATPMPVTDAAILTTLGSVNVNGGLWHNTDSAAFYLSMMRTYLNTINTNIASLLAIHSDVWDTSAHAIRTVTPP